METIKGYVEKLGSNFLVAAMVPSLTLVTAIIIVFEPILHVSWKFQDEGSIYQLIGSGLLLSIPTIIIGFTLTALNTFILKFFEGYIFVHHFPFVKKAQIMKAKKLEAKRDALEKRISVLEGRKKKTERTIALLTVLKSKYYSTAAEYDQSFPPSLEQILPTQFGNILKASESYSSTRYGIDSVSFWPRLIHVIPPSYQQAIDETRNELSFLVNVSVLSLLFTLLCLLGVVYNSLAPIILPDLQDIELIYTYRYVAAGLASLLCSLLFHRASLVMVDSFGVMIRSAYDLFRLHLLEHLRLELPHDSEEEFYIWKNLGEFIVLGNFSLGFDFLEYDLKERKGNP
jgi:hypothetical protein